MIWYVPFLLAALTVPALWLGIRYRKNRKEMPHPVRRPAPNRPEPETWKDREVTVTWVGHATCYLHFYGTRILTDPVLEERVGLELFPGLKIGPRRFVPPALSLESLKDTDLILLSHAHMDHLDLPTLKKLAHPGMTVVTAAKMGRLLKGLPVGKVVELSGTDPLRLPDGLTVKAFPVRHWGSRFPWNTDFGWTGYILEKEGRKVVFPGDTAYTSTFARLKEQGGVDLLFMPIGAYQPDALTAYHCTPEQGWRMAVEAGARWIVPIHWNTFVLSKEPVGEPIQRFLTAAGDRRKDVVIREQGEVFRFGTLDEAPGEGDEASKPLTERHKQ
ncbi:L-ascorbate metabolism protein UlaG (beta-lactamase superfamily) [Melghirimyces profundicolus]|uniref:L-ascorbate metabolism protein UlaG (Beta-lactamase superfamily) n=1 Tax=Melghirimyces profundicolus TaxID=1242148 RepID=A0A2T6C4N3_9BACL|nr:MBL fold metallo-hydrolase [Melghirimyces profundicolus]PTX63281.1 L-ascorbate metabolism protein UlaG (beta-lactamase superfamily) [Melghirimyces profundicolus]